ncbi:MAG: inositol monophosphatase family protein [bacterium]
MKTGGKMSNQLNFGMVNGHIIGRVLKEAVRRATVAIRSEREIFEAHSKQGYDGTMNDVFTSADVKAQEIYLRTFRECFPLCGVIGEESNLQIDPAPGCEAYFTVDPLDGTRAYVRRQSHGVGTMVALVNQGEVISAYVGDINTEEVYGYRPGTTKVFKITRLDTFEELRYNRPMKKGEVFGILRDPLDTYSKATQRLVKTSFKNYEVAGSSIGIWLARLWKREISVAIMEPGQETPWDSAPIIGISLRLGYVFLRPKARGRGWEEYQPVISKKVETRDHDTLIVHSKDLPSLALF